MNYILITGASGGIGKEFAYFYAEKNKNLILVARRLELLQEIKKDIVSRYPVNVEIFNLDITQTESINTILNWINDNNIRIETLINNAGVCVGGELASIEKDKISNILDLNIKALVFFCREIIPLMKENNGGNILNVASVAAFEPCPNYALYFASKAFVLNFTESIHIECKPYNIRVAALCPGFVKTDMINNLPDMPMRIAEPREVVLLGDKLLRKNRVVGVNGLVNNLLVFLAKTLPRTFLREVMRLSMQYKNKKAN